MNVGIGDPVARREDPDLVTGRGAYTADIIPHNARHIALVRSPHGHAEITDVEASPATGMDGVVAVFTAADIEASEAPGVIPVGNAPYNPPGAPVNLRRELVKPRRPLLAGDRVRHVGQPVAAVVATDPYTAHEAARLVDVGYDRLPAVTDPVAALEDDAPLIHEEAPGNVAFDWEIGDPEATDAAFDDADHTVRIERAHQRVVPTAVEPRAAVARYADGRLDVTMSTQVPYAARGLFEAAIGLPSARVRVRAPHVGGGFGSKSKFYYGEPLAAWSAMRLGRPVAFTNTRSEAFVTDAQGRARATVAELALDDDGTFRALRAHDRKDLGAFVSRVAPGINTGTFGTLLSGQYRIPAIHGRVTAAFTNLPPTDAYRGSSRPDAAYTVERLVSAAATELGMDPVEIRRHNFVPADAFPYETPVDASYDSGQYETTLDEALERADYDALTEKRRAVRDDGGLYGIGFATFIEKAGSGPGGVEAGRVTVLPDGTVEAAAGTADQGQGHETTFAQVLAEELGVGFEDVTFSAGDTAAFARGTGTFGSRSAIMAGSALVESAREVIERGRRVAADRLEADPADVTFEAGEFAVQGAPGRSIGLAEVAAAAYAGEGPPDEEPVLESTTYYRSEGLTFPYGAHLAAVEIDPDTGEIGIDTYVAVDDCGVQINPALVEGQVVGGIAQGMGQALLEGAVYDDNGALLTGSLTDYAMPRAGTIPEIVTGHTTSPSPRNPLGVKGAGESGAVGPPTALTNAVLDALSPLGVTDIDMPMTPDRVWRTIRDAEAA